MKESTQTFTINGQEVEVEFQYSEPCPGDYWTPPSPGELKICKIEIGGIEITDIIEHCGSIETLEEEFYTQFMNGVSDAKDEHLINNFLNNKHGEH